jgi:hypothetical protein
MGFAGMIVAPPPQLIDVAEVKVACLKCFREMVFTSWRNFSEYVKLAVVFSQPVSETESPLVKIMHFPKALKCPNPDSYLPLKNNVF